MQCFGGCFSAADRGAQDFVQHATVDGKDCRSGADAWSSTRGSKTVQNGSSTAADFQPAPDAGQRSFSKPKLRLLSGKSSRSGKSESSQQLNYTRSTLATPEERDRLRREYLMQHGRHILGISTLQQDELYHFEVPGIGYIAYAMMFNGLEVFNTKTAVGLSDPVCAPEHFRMMAELFLREHPKAMWVQVSYNFATILQDFDFLCNSMGGETRLDVATYNFTGYARRGLRSAIASAVKDGITVEEVMNPEAHTFGLGAAKGAGAAAAKAAGTSWQAVQDEMAAVDAKWAASRPGRANDVWFINRPPVFKPEAGVRKFVARNAAGEMQGFIFFDGVFEDGQLVGYYANVTRLLPNAHPGTLNLMMKEFLERVRAEAQLSAPAKKLSMRKSQRKKLEAAAAAAAAEAAATAAAGGDATPAKALDQLKQQPSKQLSEQLSEQPSEQPAGPKFLSLGLSPFYQMNNVLKYCKVTHLLLLLCYEDGAGFYPFKTLAAAKAKYGAGLHNFKYEDPNVEYRNAFICHNRKGVNASFWCMYDVAKLYGFWTDPMDCFGRYFRYKGKQGAELVARGVKKATSIDTYKRLKSKGNKKSLKVEKSNTLSSSFTAGDRRAWLDDDDLCSAVSAPAVFAGRAGRSASGGGAVRGAAGMQKQQRQGTASKKAAQKAAAAGAVAAAAAGGGAVASGALARGSRSQSEASLITTTAAPRAASTADTATSEAASDIASLVSTTGVVHSADDNTAASRSSSSSDA